MDVGWFLTKNSHVSRFIENNSDNRQSHMSHREWISVVRFDYYLSAYSAEYALLFIELQAKASF